MEYFLKVQTPIFESALTIGLSYRPVAWLLLERLRSGDVLYLKISLMSVFCAAAEN